MAQVKFNYGTNKTELDKKSLAEGSIWFSTEDGKLNIDVKDGNATLKRTTVNAAKADEASKLSTARSITLKGGVSSTTTFDGTKNIELTVPAATNNVAGVTVVYPAAQCTTFTSDSGTCTPAAVKKAVTLFGVSNAGDTMSGNLIFNNPNATVPGEHPHIEWATTGANTPYIGYATDQTDGTFLIGSLKGTTYSSGLAIGGGSGNLLWQSKKVLTIDNSCVATQSINGSMSANDKQKVDVTNIAYGTCSTAAATAAKVVTVSVNTNWALTAGSIITVLFSNTNTAENPTLNVNGTGAKAIKYCGSTITTSNITYGGYKNRPQVFMYDGTSYHFISWGYESGNTNTLLRTYKDESSTYPILASRTAASSWDATYESVYGTIASNITMTPSTGTITATAFSGSGASLTSLNASNISSGTIAAARLPAATTSALGAVKVGTGLSVSSGTISNSGVRSISTGSTNGTISVNTNGTSAEVAVKGLGSNAYTSTAYLPLTGGTVTGTLILSKTTDLSGTANNSPALIVGGAATVAHLEIDANEIQAKTNGTTTAELYINNDGGRVSLPYLKILDTTAQKHIAFSREGFNYITVPTSGSLAFVMDGQSIGDTTSELIITKGNLRPGTTNVTSLGTSSYKWSNVYATTFTGSLSGNASTATKLATARTISLTGAITGSGSFDGSGNLSITTTAAGYLQQVAKWNCTITCATWSRLCYIPCEVAVVGTKFLLFIGATRGNVVYNDLFVITTHHSANGNIVKIGGNNYSNGYQLRILSDSNGSCYVELYDALVSATSSTTQTVYCRLIPIFVGAGASYYTNFTSGASIPSGFTVKQTMTMTNNHVQADSIQGAVWN